MATRMSKTLRHEHMCVAELFVGLCRLHCLQVFWGHNPTTTAILRVSTFLIGKLQHSPSTVLLQKNWLIFLTRVPHLRLLCELLYDTGDIE